MGMDMEGGGTPQKSESRDHADKSEAMVTMQMRDKHPTKLGEMEMGLPQLHLRSFCTIKHQQAVSHLYELGRCIVSKGGKRTSTP